MKPLPIRRAQFDLSAFAAWLAANGAEIRIPTNPYEVVRYLAFDRAKGRALTHIVYMKENGLLTFTGRSAEHYRAMLDGKRVSGMFVSTLDPVSMKEPRPGRRSRSSAEVLARLLGRDGDECWFCGEAMGDDCTIEHLVPRASGGRNAMDNYALAHASCNQLAADRPLVDKIALRARMRAERIDH